ncbi:MAG: hypothetical protein QGG02_01280 [Gammaproteobacteria bacterium]|nr:hypothetical protein [Gammaproteobacteria bacterium]
MGNFFQELKRRRVIKTVLYYIAGAWVTLQVVDVLTPALDLPSWFLAFILYVFLIGFPVVTLLAWFYDITTSGLERDSTDFGGAKRSLNRNVILLTLSVLVIAVISSYFLVISDERYFQSSRTTSIVYPVSTYGTDIVRV